VARAATAAVEDVVEAGVTVAAGVGVEGEAAAQAVVAAGVAAAVVVGVVGVRPSPRCVVREPAAYRCAVRTRA
jgi:hypothetical protein